MGLCLSRPAIEGPITQPSSEYINHPTSNTSPIDENPTFSPLFNKYHQPHRQAVAAPATDPTCPSPTLTATPIISTTGTTTTTTTTSPNPNNSNSHHTRHDPHSTPPTIPSLSTMQPLVKTPAQLAMLDKAMSNNPLFQGVLDADFRRDVALNMTMKRVNSGHIVIQEGDNLATKFYIIEDGECQVTKRCCDDDYTEEDGDGHHHDRYYDPIDGPPPSPSPCARAHAGRGGYGYRDPGPFDKVVATLGPGDGFGELALLYNAPRAATVTTITPCTLWIMERQSYASLRREHEKRAAYLRKKAADAATVFSTLLPEHRAVLAELLELVTFKPGQVLGSTMPRTTYNSNKRKNPNPTTQNQNNNRSNASSGSNGLNSARKKNQDGRESGGGERKTETRPSNDQVVYLIKSGNAIHSSSSSSSSFGNTVSYGPGDCIYSHQLTSPSTPPLPPPQTNNNKKKENSTTGIADQSVVASSEMTCYALRVRAIQDLFQVPFQALLRYPYLANIPELSALSENQLLQLAACMEEMRYDSDERVFSKGDVGDAFFVVVSGMFHVTDEYEENEDPSFNGIGTTTDNDGGDKIPRKKKKLLAECGPGKCFGELALLRRQPRAATVTAIMEDSTALMCKKEAFEAHLGSLQDIQLMWRVEALKKVPILGLLNQKQRSRLAKLMEQQQQMVLLNDGDVLINKGDRLKMLYLVERGELMATNPDIVLDVSNNDTPKSPSIADDNKKKGASHKKLTAGAYFGEKTLIKKKEGDSDTNTAAGTGIKKKSIQSAVNIHSVGPSIVCLLSKEVLIDALGHERYEEFVIQAQQLLSQIAATKQADAAAAAAAVAVAGNYKKKMAIPSPTGGSTITITAYGGTALSPSIAATKSHMSIREYDFEEIGHLGSGAYGHVSLVRDHKSGTLHALKVLNKAQIISAGLVQHAKRERALMSEASTSPFILNLRDAFQDNRNLYYLLEPIYGGDLFTFVQNMEESMTEKDVMFYVGCVVLGLEHLHSKNIAWRDLKPENLLIDSNGYLKLADFGFARRFPDFVLSKSFTLCGTPEYLAPELVKNIGHNAACDWWALGILTYELAAGKPPFRSDDRIEMFRSICDVEYEFPKHFSPEIKDFIKRMLIKQPERRLGMPPGGVTEVKRHPFLRKLDWDALAQRRYPAPFSPSSTNKDDIISRKKKKKASDGRIGPERISTGMFADF